MNWARRLKSQSEANLGALNAVWNGVERFTKVYYVNTDPGASAKRVRETYGGNYERLVQLKNRYDPTNLFRLNANMEPARG